MARPTTPRQIDGTAKEVAGQMVGDTDLETAGRHERRGGDHSAGLSVEPRPPETAGTGTAGTANEAGEAAVATVAGAVKEAVGRVLGIARLARRGRRERRRRRGPGV